MVVSPDHGASLSQSHHGRMGEKLTGWALSMEMNELLKRVDVAASKLYWLVVSSARCACEGHEASGACGCVMKG